MPSLLELVADLQLVAEQTNSFGYQFRYRDDKDLKPAFDERGVDQGCELVQVYVTPDGGYTLQPCDRAGRPAGHPVLPNDGRAYHVGQQSVVAPAKSLYDQVREELAQPKRRWWRRG